MSGEPTPAQPAAPAATATAEKPVDAWGQSISAERQAKLQRYLDRWQAETDHGYGKGPFDGIQLTGADVSWLAEHSGRNHEGRVPNLHLEGANLIEAHLEGANLIEAHLEGANLGGAHLERASFHKAHLEGASLMSAHLEGAYFSEAYLGGAYLSGTHLEGADLFAAHLERAQLEEVRLQGARLTSSHLEGASLRFTHLEGATLNEAHLEGADFLQAHLDGARLRGVRLAGARLREAHLEGIDLDGARLERADLTGASFDKTSRLNDAVLTAASFDQVTFDNTNLAVIDWSRVTTLGDEHTARRRTYSDNKLKPRLIRLAEYNAAVRANRVLSVNLQGQGLAEDADRFAYQAKVLQRQVLRLQRKYGAYLFSLLLAGLAGYGYRLRRILIAYGLAVLLFAAGYFFAGGIVGQAQGLAQAHPSLQQQALDALQVSLNAIHGRVFFTQLGLDTLQSWLATLESIVGIVIEGVFVAMLIQRFFGR